MSRILGRVLAESGSEKAKLVGAARSHAAVAVQVSAGRADLGLAAREAAEEAGLAARKVAEDEIIFLVRPERRGRDVVGAFVEAL